MTTSTPNREHAADDLPSPDNRVRLSHLRVGLPGAVPDPPGSGEPVGRHLSEVLAPFVAWLATQDLGEPARRRHRDAAERYLRWSHADTGPVGDRRLRYERHLRRHDADHLPDARSGLGWWTDHRQILALTQPAEGRPDRPCRWSPRR